MNSNRGLMCILLMATAATASTLALSACSGSDRQDATEPSGSWQVDVLSATFPPRQHLATKAKLRITVKNIDNKEIPNLVITIDGFTTHLDDPTLADPERPIWIIDAPPRNSQTTDTHTWTAGRVEPGEVKAMTWRVTAVRAGTYTLRYRVAAGLNGKARAQLANGAVPHGSLTATIVKQPRPVEIN